MRVRTWVLIVAAVLAILFGFLGRGLDIRAFSTVSGMAWLTVIGIGISMLPFWRKILPDVPPLPGLFTRPAAGQRWCGHCGSATDAGACHVCGHAPKVKEPKAPKVKPTK